jgi:hypothetical protein
MCCTQLDTRARDVPTSNTAIKFWENHVELMETYNPNQAPLQSGLHEMSVMQKRKLSRIQLCAAHFNKQLEYFCVDHDVSTLSLLTLSRSIIAIIFFSTSMTFRFRSLNSRDCDAPFAAVANDSTFKHTLWLLDRHSLQQTRHSFMDKLGKLSNLRKDSEDLRVFISKAKELREVFGFVEQSSVDIHAFLLKHLKKSEIAELESNLKSIS